MKQGQTFALYVILYTFGRFWFENLRIDPAHDIGPLRVNAWVSIVLFVVRHRGGSGGSAVTSRASVRPRPASAVGGTDRRKLG